jgi:hypothetical protein
MKVLFPALLFMLLTVWDCNRRDLGLFSPSTYFPEEDSDTTLILENTTPENVLENLKTSYNKRRYDIFQDLIDTSYKFYMSETYLGAINAGFVDPPDPAAWTLEMDSSESPPVQWYYKTYEQEITTIRNMFDPTTGAKDIELYFQASLTYQNQDPPDTVIYKIKDIRLTVTLREPPGYVMEANDFSQLEPSRAKLVKFTDGKWKIVEWWDRTGGSYDAM